MSNSTSNQTKNQNASQPAGTTFNYAAAAAKSKQQQQQQQQQAQQQQQQQQQQNTQKPSGTANNTDASTPAAVSRTATPNGNAQDGKNKSSSSAAAVSMPSGNPTTAPANVAFGSVHDTSAALSSSPAVQPKSGQHLQGDKPAQFGSVPAANAAQQKVVGFSGNKDAAPSKDAAKDGQTTTTTRPTMDFQKLFQTGGKNKSQTASAPATDKAPAAAAATATGETTAAAAAPVTPSKPTVNQQPQQQQPAATGGNALRPPQQSGAQPFEPQRSPAAHFTPAQQQQQQQQSGAAPSPGLRTPSSAAAQPFHPHQQQRSPMPQGAHAMPQQHNMMGQPGAHPGHPQWQGQPGYYPPQYMQQYGYQYASAPQPWQPGGPQQQQQQQQQQQPQQQQQYDAAGSPRHANQAAPPPGSSVAASPASSRQQAAPYSPSTAPSSIASPQMPHGAHPQQHHHHPHHPLGMGLPSGPRPPGGPYHQPSGSYGGGGHAHTHSFGGGVNPLSPAARQFEPGQAAKRVSSAIRIVNPDTKAAIDIKSPASKPPAAAAATTSSPSTAPAAAAAPASSSPAPTPATPAAASSPSPAPAAAAAKPAATPAAATPSSTTTSLASSEPPVQSCVKSAPKAPPKPLATAQSFQAQVQARIAARKAAEEAEAAEKKKAESEAEAEKKKAADAEAAKKREEEEKAAAEKKKVEEEAAKKEAERKEAEAKAASEAQEKAAREKDAAEAAAAEQKKKDEETARQAQAAEADKAVDNSKLEKGSEAATEAKINAQDAVATGEKTGAEAGKDSASAAGAAKSVADIERMAREVSSVPSTPIEPSVSRTPLFPTTPRTPGTPGFAGLPAKPMSNINNSSSNNAPAAGGATPAAAAAASTNGTGNFNLDSAQLESRRRPSQLDTAAAQRVPSTANTSTPVSGTAASSHAVNNNAGPSNAAAETPVSAASASLGSARFIDDLNKVTYPTSVQSPKKELNQSAEPGKFRYDRDFLLQFMGVYSEKPQDMPALASIGMEQGQMGAGGGRAGSGRRASGIPPGGSSGRGGNAGGLGLGIGGGSGFGRGAGGMGQFSHPAKTSEERFAQANAGRGAPGGAFGSSGPMGSFAGGRTQPLSRGGSGSGALPSRDMMGTGTPAGGRTQSRRGRTREPGQGRGGNDRVNPPEKGGPTIPLDQVVPLSHSDNRWQAGSGQKLSDDSPELIQRKVKALLNKLTVEKFASISDQILDWANKSVDETDGSTLRLVIALIFEKATDEAAWSEMYAQLCRKLMERVSTDVSDESIKNSEGQPIVGGQLFRKYLLTRCQIDFERGWAHRDAMVDAAKGKEAEDKAKKASNEQAEADAKEATERGEKTEEKEAELMSDEYYAAQKAKRRGLGLVRFIGELYKLQMLTERIIHSCLKKLLQNTKDPEEEEIESLCKLLTTVGAQLDTDRARSHMDIYVLRMQEMTKSDAVNSRMKFMLLDVIELRAANWKGKQQAAGPKSIAQIHEDAAKQKQQAEAEMAARSSSGRGMPPSRGGSRRGQQRGEFGGGPMGPDGWTAVGAGAPPPPRPTRAGDMSGFGKIERSGSGRPLSLGLAPNNVFAKKQQKSSEDGSKPPSRTASSTNMFEMLGQAESEQAAQAASSSGGGERPRLKLAPRTKPLFTGTEEGEGEGEGEEDEEDEKDEDAEEKKAGAAPAEELSEEDLKRKVDNDIKEFLAVRDVKEGALAMEALPASQRSVFVSKMVEVVLNKKEDDVRTVGRLLSEVRSQSLMDDASFETGFKNSGMDMLDDIAIDVPSVYKFMAILVVSSGLPQEKVEQLAETIEGDGLKPPKTKFLEKVQAERDESS